MQKTSNAKALTFIDALLTEIRSEKVAEESPINATAKSTGGSPAGTVPAKVEDKVDTSPDKTKVEEKAKEGAFSKEKSGDLDAGPGTNVEDPKAENSENPSGQANTGDMGAKPIEGKKEETPSAVEAEKLKVAEEEKKMINEFKRAQTVGNLVLAKIAERAELTKKSEEAAPDAQIEALIKQAADEAYQEFVTSYEAGLLKRAEDEAAIQEALGVSPDEASGYLDEIATENPEAVLPAEEMGEETGEEDPEGDVDADEILAALVEAGVTPEDIAEAESEVAAEEGGEAPMGVEAAEKQAVSWEGTKDTAGEVYDYIKDAVLWRKFQKAKKTWPKIRQGAESVGITGGLAGLGAGAGYGVHKGLQALYGPKEEKEAAEAFLKIARATKLPVPSSMMEKVKGGMEKVKGGAKDTYDYVKDAILWRKFQKAKGLGKKTLRGAEAVGITGGLAGAAAGAGYGAHKGLQALYGKKKEDKEAAEKQAVSWEGTKDTAGEVYDYIKDAILWRKFQQAKGLGKRTLRGAEAVGITGGLAGLGAGAGYGVHKGLQALYGPKEEKEAAERDARKEGLKEVIRALRA